MLVTLEDPLVLGSASPRRREILSSMGIPIVVRKGDIDESRRAGEPAEEYLERIVKEKLADVIRRHPVVESAPGVLVADTVVVVDGDVLGKPKDVDEAFTLVSRLVGRTHLVRTRYALSLAPEHGIAAVSRTIETRVTMRAASAEEVRCYAETREGLDKAGAYAGQGIGSFLIERIDGSFSNVVGLPACEVVQDLVGSGLLVGFPRAVP